MTAHQPAQAALSPDDPDTILSIENVTRTFGPVTALRGVSFRIRRGTIHGLLGANGAGNAPTKLSKTGAIKAALEAHPGIMPKELAIILKEEGWDVSPQRISVIKSTLKKGAYPAKSKAAPAANAARPAASAPTTGSR